MRKFLLLSLLFMSAATMMADDIQKLDAAKVTRITFNGDNVIISFTDGTSSTYDMEAVTIDFSNVTSIGERIEMSKKMGLEGKQVYDLKGRRAGKSVANLKKGIYIVDGKKVIIK